MVPCLPYKCVHYYAYINILTTYFTIISIAKFRSCLMIEYVYTCLNMICLSVIMIANHVLVTCLTIKRDQDANEFYQCKNIICSLDYHC